MIKNVTDAKIGMKNCLNTKELFILKISTSNEQTRYCLMRQSGKRNY